MKGARYGKPLLISIAITLSLGQPVRHSLSIAGVVEDMCLSSNGMEGRASCCPPDRGDWRTEMQASI
jgi:hypothetical protein